MKRNNMCSRCDDRVLFQAYAKAFLESGQAAFQIHLVVSLHLFRTGSCGVTGRVTQYLQCVSPVRYEDLVIFQFQLAKKNDVVPLTRNYIREHEQSKAKILQAANA